MPQQQQPLPAPLPPAPHPPHHVQPPFLDPQQPAGEEPPPPASTMLGWQPTQEPAWVHGYKHQPVRAEPLPPPSDQTETMQGPPTVVASVRRALRRAFRLYIDPGEVTDAERSALESATPPITDRDVQAFLAWRRSVLLVVAIAILPLLLVQIVNVAGSKTGGMRALLSLQFLVDVGFTALLWSQLREWTNWRKQRRLLTMGWLAFFLMPFVLHLYPWRSVVADSLASQPVNPELIQLGSVLAGMVASIGAMIDLAPRAISLMPGLLRGAIISKLLFPGASGPGWLVLLLAPIYALLMYVVLIIPYQLTGNGYFVPALIGLLAAQIWLGRMGYQLARPERLEEVLVLVRRVRGTYVAINVLGLVFVMFGLADLLKQLDIPVWRGLQALLALLVNVLLLTIIATDQIVANLVRGQRLLSMPGTSEAQAEFARDISHFDEDPRS